MGYYTSIRGFRAIFMVTEPQYVLTCRSLTIAVWPILARFMDYYSPFLGGEAIYLVDVPHGALTCMTLTLTVLADSGPFHGLLLTVLGSRSDFHSC